MLPTVGRAGRFPCLSPRPGRFFPRSPLLNLHCGPVQRAPTSCRRRRVGAAIMFFRQRARRAFEQKSSASAFRSLLLPFRADSGHMIFQIPTVCQDIIPSHRIGTVMVSLFIALKRKIPPRTNSPSTDQNKITSRPRVPLASSRRCASAACSGGNVAATRSVMSPSSTCCRNRSSKSARWS